MSATDDTEAQRHKQSFFQAVLQWSLKHQDKDADRTFVQEMDPARRAFLAKVLESMSQDVIKVMRDALAILHDHTATEPAKLEALESLHELVEDLDNARDLATLGGVPMLADQLQHSAYPSVQSEAADILATMTQNNPQLQETVVQAGVLAALRNTLLGARDETVRLKCLRAISCTIRESPAQLGAFFADGGAEFLAQTLHGAPPRLAAKVLFFVACLSDNEPVFLEQLRGLALESGLLAAIVAQLTAASGGVATPEVWLFGLRALQLLANAANVAFLRTSPVVAAVNAHVAALDALADADDRAARADEKEAATGFLSSLA